MYNPNQPLTAFVDEEINYDNQSQPRSRPLSTKYKSGQKNRRNTRPISAVKKITRIRNNPDRTIINKMMPRIVTHDKERLYEEQLAIKLKYNAIQEENIRLKTRINTLEKELNKKEAQQLEPRGFNSNNLKNSHLILNLKQSNKDLRAQVKSLEETIQGYKRNLRSTRVSELEIEVQAYIDECTRLRHHLETMIQIKENQQPILNIEEVQEMQNNQNIMINNLRKENQELINELNRAKNESLKNTKKGRKKGHDQNLKAEITKLKNQLKSNRQEYENREKELLGEIQNLKGSQGNHLALDNDLKARMDQKVKKFEDPPEFLIQINQYLQRKQISIDQFIQQLIKNQDDQIDCQVLYNQLKNLGFAISKDRYSNDLYILIGIKTGGFEPSQLQNAYNRYIYPEVEQLREGTPPINIPQSEVQNTLDHIAMRLQLHRISKDKIFEALFNQTQTREVTVAELSILFSKSPFQVADQDENTHLAQFCCERSSNSNQFVVDKLKKSLPDWTPFTSEQEQQYDQIISDAISKNKITLKEACKISDIDETGFITIDEFKEALADSGIDFNDNVFNYMKLLFYSHQNQLNQVPYRHLIKAYGNPKEQTAQSDDEVTEMVQYYIQIIAENFNNKNCKFSDIFKKDKRGLIYPEQFQQAMQKLDVSIPDEHLYILMDALQYEEEQNFQCILSEEFEEILQHYGVEQSSSEASKQKKTMQNEPKEIEESYSSDYNSSDNFSNKSF